MSRKAKLVVLGIFIALFAIPIGYTVLAWQMADPLRFKYSRWHSLRGNSQLGEVEIIIENTSDFPVRVYAFGIQKQDARILPNLGLNIYNDEWGQESMIEPRGILRFRSRWYALKEADRVPIGSRAHYHWQPTARERFGRLFYFVRARLPEGLAKHFPILYPHEHTSPIECGEN